MTGLMRTPSKLDEREKQVLETLNGFPHGLGVNALWKKVQDKMSKDLLIKKLSSLETNGKVKWIPGPRKSKIYMATQDFAIFPKSWIREIGFFESNVAAIAKLISRTDWAVKYRLGLCRSVVAGPVNQLVWRELLNRNSKWEDELQRTILGAYGYTIDKFIQKLGPNEEELEWAVTSTTRIQEMASMIFFNPELVTHTEPDEKMAETRLAESK